MREKGGGGGWGGGGGGVIVQSKSDLDKVWRLTFFQVPYEFLDIDECVLYRIRSKTNVVLGDYVCRLGLHQG